MKKYLVQNLPSFDADQKQRKSPKKSFKGPKKKILFKMDQFLAQFQNKGNLPTNIVVKCELACQFAFVSEVKSSKHKIKLTK